MPVFELILLAAFGALVIGWGARMDMKNYGKEQAAKARPETENSRTRTH